MFGSTLGFPHYGFSSLAPDPFHAKARSREGKALDPIGGTIVLIVFGSWREQLRTAVLHCGPKVARQSLVVNAYAIEGF